MLKQNSTEQMMFITMVAMICQYENLDGLVICVIWMFVRGNVDDDAKLRGDREILSSLPLWYSVQNIYPIKQFVLLL